MLSPYKGTDQIAVAIHAERRFGSQLAGGGLFGNRVCVERLDPSFAIVCALFIDSCLSEAEGGNHPLRTFARFDPLHDAVS